MYIVRFYCECQNVLYSIMRPLRRLQWEDFFPQALFLTIEDEEAQKWFIFVNTDKAKIYWNGPQERKNGMILYGKGSTKLWWANLEYLDAEIYQGNAKQIYHLLLQFHTKGGKIRMWDANQQLKKFARERSIERLTKVLI